MTDDPPPLRLNTHTMWLIMCVIGLVSAAFGFGIKYDDLLRKGERDDRQDKVMALQGKQLRYLYRRECLRDPTCPDIVE